VELIELTKVCSKCGERKGWLGFHKKKSGCWGLKNLQLLPLMKNKIKGGKLNKPFQPSLPL